MDGNRFDALTRSAASRRGFLWSAVAVSTASFGLPGIAAGKRKPKTGKPNAFGCINVGDPCRRSRQCCSSICTGKKGKKRCRAHDEGGCAAGEQPSGCGGTDVACITSLDEEGTCATTTGNAGYCLSSGDCYPCTVDADCRSAAGGVLGPRAACIRCADCEETGTACATPKQLVGIRAGRIQGAL